LALWISVTKKIRPALRSGSSFEWSRPQATAELLRHSFGSAEVLRDAPGGIIVSIHGEAANPKNIDTAHVPISRNESQFQANAFQEYDRSEIVPPAGNAR
jgi:hypothetical protein